MAIVDLFSKRQKRIHGDFPDVYVYDKIPDTLRVQIIHIWDYALGNILEYDDELLHVKKMYRLIVGNLCREYGMFTLASYTREETRNFRYELQAFFLSETDHRRLIDTIELSFMTIDQKTRNNNYKNAGNPDQIADNAINELNQRFKEHIIGYKFEDGLIIRIDSELLHSKIIKPALRFLNHDHFKSAQQEFLMAYGNYLKGNTKGALIRSHKAFKNTMKAICDKNGWPYNTKATSKTLIKICLDMGLIPSYWEPQINALRIMLENGIPTGPSKLIDQRQGTPSKIIPDHVVTYVLHMTASAIVFLGESENAMNN
jgi:hypothetical protein